MKKIQINKEHVLITGTTSGVGRGLMDFYVRKGSQVTAVNRRRDAQMESLYPGVRFYTIDVQDARDVAGLIEKLAISHDIPTLFILNAGINQVDNDPIFSLEAFRETLEINLYGVLNFVTPLIARQTELPEIKIIAVSSTAKYAANPYCLGYYISKKALAQCFEVFYEMYRHMNLQFKWVVLGPVETKITSSASMFPKIMSQIKDSFSVSVEKTAKAIANLATSNRSRMVFPLRARFLFRGIWLAQRLIPGFYRGRKSPQP